MLNLIKQSKITPSSAGFVLPVFTITILLVSFMVISISSGASLNYRRAARETYNVNAQLAADAGLDEALIELTADSSWTGSGGEINLLDTANLRTTYETTVSDGASSSLKIISVVSRSYSPADSVVPDVTRRYEIDVEAVTSGTAPASVVSGVGGLVLSNNAKISGGDVLVNGRITLSNNAQIGLSTNPVNVRVAHQSCPNPPDASFPQVCGSGENGQPITIGNNGRIYGDVRATNQTDGSQMSNPGLIAGQTFDPVPLPDYDREAHKAAVASELTAVEASCGNNGVRTWPANVKIDGDVSVGNNCRVNILGDVWITGRLNGSNNIQIVVDDSVGTNPPTFMIDGTTSSNNHFTIGNNGRIVPNSDGSGVQIIAFWSAAACSPDCGDVTGPALANSQNQETIVLSNNGSAQNSVFYSRWSKIRVSNNGGLGAVAGQTVELGDNAVISFTAAVPGSDNLITTWVKRGYMRVYQ